MRRSGLSGNSPARKRARLSSPTYDETMPEPSQDELAAFDELEARHSQHSPSKRQSLRSPIQAEFDDEDNPFIAPQNPSAVPSFISASRIATTSALNHTKSPSPDTDTSPEKDYSGWFQPMDCDTIPGFQSAGFATPSGELSLGFRKASNTGIMAPSKEAYLKAQQKMDALWSEEVGNEAASPPPQDLAPIIQPAPMPSDPRPALKALENSVAFQTALQSTLRETPQHIPDSPPRISSALKGKPKAFVSPLISSAQKHDRASTADSHSSPFIKSSLLTSGASTAPTYSQAQQQQKAFSTPLVNRDKRTEFKTPLPATPSRPLGLPVQRNSGSRKTPASFVTPFKKGTLASNVAASPLSVQNSSACVNPKPTRVTFFNLKKPPNRSTLNEVFSPQPLRFPDGVPQDLTELTQISPELAIYYSFHSSDAKSLLGATEAFEHLKKLGCTLVTKGWVDNHWSLILWKLSGLALQDIDHGQNPRQRWCWNEVIRQLLYRYERELNSGIRPPFRLITTQDMPPSYPMVLCISRITWITREDIEESPETKSTAYPELEVSDGWYRLRAQVDPALERAIRRGIIRVGRKLFVAGTRLSSERKEPSEVLEAYNSTKLIFSGNSSHLAPWHAKLGYHKGVCLSTLHSLTADGGLIATMDIVIIKTHPIAFLEFFEEDGKKRSEGPRNEAEEAKLDQRWQRGRDDHISKLQAALEKKWHRYHGYMERLWKKAGNRFKPSNDDYPPDCIDDFYAELELPETASATLSRISPQNAGWLAQHIAKQSDIEKARASDDIEQELKTLFPARNVRSFQVIVAQDSRTQRRPAHRSAQLTVWDALRPSNDEEGGSGFQAGQRWIVTNLTPTQMKAWMGNVPGSEVYLATRRDSKWMKLK